MDYLLHILTVIYQDGFKDYDEVQREIITAARNILKNFSGEVIETPHGTLRLFKTPNLLKENGTKKEQTNSRT